jgi:hypothetical protein
MQSSARYHHEPFGSNSPFLVRSGCLDLRNFHKMLGVLTTAQVHETAALQLGMDMKLFDIAVTAGGPLTVNALAEKASADALLVG